MTNNEQFFIFSVEYFKNSNEENKHAVALTRKILEKSNIPYIDVDGCYKGVTEMSFLVPAKFENEVLEIAKAAKQHSLLFVDSKKGATLIYLNGDVEKLDGKFQRVDRDEALSLEAFTRCAVTNTYWAVV